MQEVKIPLEEENDVVKIALFIKVVMDAAISSLKEKDEAYDAVEGMDEDELKKYAVLGAHLSSAFHQMNEEAEKIALKGLLSALKDKVGVPDEDGEDVETPYVRPAADKPDVMYG